MKESGKERSHLSDCEVLGVSREGQGGDRFHGGVGEKGHLGVGLGVIENHSRA